MYFLLLILCVVFLRTILMFAENLKKKIRHLISIFQRGATVNVQMIQETCIVGDIKNVHQRGLEFNPPFTDCETVGTNQKTTPTPSPPRGCLFTNADEAIIYNLVVWCGQASRFLRQVNGLTRLSVGVTVQCKTFRARQFLDGKTKKF